MAERVTRIIIFGSRDWVIWQPIIDVIKHYKNLYPDLLIVHGDCPLGADNIAECICLANGVPTEKHPANWDKYGKPAGHIRNREMAELGAFAAFGFSVSDPYTPGTKNMWENCQKYKIPVDVFVSDEGNYGT